MSGRKTLVAMSGGVDSSVAALLCKEQGLNPVGVTMCLGVNTEADDPRCCGPEGIADARRVCDYLGIPHYVWDFAEIMRQKVIDPFREAYRQGRTPNPCVDCNRYLKFEELLKRGKGLGFDVLVTGHYAEVVKTDSSVALVRPADRHKDQTYFLYGIRYEDLASIYFPLARMQKSEVRDMARAAGLPVAEKSESQDICFVGKGTYRDILGSTAQPGDIVDESGNVVGTHTGIEHYTIGQRKGLGIAAAHPLYVVAVDALNNKVIVGSKNAGAAKGLIARDLNMLVEFLPVTALVQIRYQQKPIAATCVIESEELMVMFDSPLSAVTPGQSVVLYEGDKVLGGGIIEKALF
jgi:tRNA-specific 2-thiouridylase